MTTDGGWMSDTITWTIEQLAASVGSHERHPHPEQDRCPVAMPYLCVCYQFATVLLSLQGGPTVAVCEKHGAAVLEKAPVPVPALTLAREGSE